MSSDVVAAVGYGMCVSVPDKPLPRIRFCFWVTDLYTHTHLLSKHSWTL